LRLKILSINLIILLGTLFYPLHVKHVSLTGKLFHVTKENTELQQKVTYLSARLEKTILSEIGFERCKKNDEKSAPKFVPSSSYHKEEESLKPTKTHYPSNPKPSFNPKRGVKRESVKSKKKAFVCMFCGHADHLDEFCFRCKRIERRHVEYARNSYRDEFIDFLPRSYSHVPPRFYSRAFS
jgi:hypothetical protein